MWFQTSCQSIIRVQWLTVSSVSQAISSPIGLLMLIFLLPLSCRHITTGGGWFHPVHMHMVNSAHSSNTQYFKALKQQYIQDTLKQAIESFNHLAWQQPVSTVLWLSTPLSISTTNSDRRERLMRDLLSPALQPRTCLSFRSTSSS